MRGLRGPAGIAAARRVPGAQAYARLAVLALGAARLRSRFWAAVV